MGLREEDLSELEAEALAAFRENKRLPMGLQKTLPWYNQFLQGRSLKDIHVAAYENDDHVTFGHVVDACLRFRWFDRRDEALNQIMENVSIRFINTASESVEYLSTYMKATHKLQGGKLKRYLASGDESDLQGMDLNDMEKYTAVAKMFQTMAGKDKVAKVVVENKRGRKEAITVVPNAVPAIQQAEESVTDVLKQLESAKAKRKDKPDEDE
jgi:hypothetical protein